MKQELIPIYEHNGKQAVSARLLHAFLESKQDFSTWIKNRINKYDLVENQDYASFHKIMEREIGATTTI
ncbi:MAG: antA/AntB antirepressor family protein, partial [Prevotellaceae bacterium]|nr:antA/AntB antirepressor family protein [Prevotellaceae bacterium]